MRTLQIDEKWSIEYDPSDNNRPKRALRYEEFHSNVMLDNLALALFYALLEERRIHELENEPTAVAHSYDGCGYQFIDNGSGGDWLERGMSMPDATPLYEKREQGE